MPRYKRGSGSVYQQVKYVNGKKKKLKTWWLYYYHNGERIRESSGTTDKETAKKLLQTKMGQIADGRYTPGADQITYEDLVEDLVLDYKILKKKSLDKVLIRLKNHLTPFFRGKKAHAITTTVVKRFVQQRQEEQASDAEINRELAALKRAFNLGIKAGKISKKPDFPHLEENNVRKGFFERSDFDQIIARLPDYLRSALTFAYVTGWRVRSEILSLKWEQVDLEASTVKLYRGTTKNKEARIVNLFPEIMSTIEQQWTEHLQQWPMCPFVFHRKGRQIKDFRKVWMRACQEVGISGKIPHDFRRSAVRNLIRAGIPEHVAMMITGHKTREVFRRYNIVSDSDMKDAALKMRKFFLANNSHTFGHTLDSSVSVSH